jgi:hypothetical protein
MRFATCLLPVVALLPLAGCGSSPTKPSSTDPGASGPLLGQTVNAIDGSVSPNVTVQIGSKESVTSDAGGLFQVDVDPGTYPAVVRGSAVIDRETRMTGPSSDRVRVSLIPASFDLSAFNEMFRATNARLQRWTTKPSVVIVATVMQYKADAGDTYVATSEQMTTAEVSQLEAHLTEGLTLLSGKTYTSFSSVSVERPAAKADVVVLRTGTIVVGRYNGISDVARTIGYGQWAYMPDGRIAGGAMFLDRDFDRNDARRRLLRIHELGHALGCQHVESRTSIMNPIIGPEPNDFDRSSALIAYQRPVGNKAPDVDPTTSTLSMETGEVRWSVPVPSRLGPK